MSAPAPGLIAALNRRLRRLPVWPLWVLGLLPGLWTFWLALHGALGPDPVRAFELALGRWALKFLVASLAVTPLLRLTGIGLMRFRRALGLIAFVYVVAHLAVWLFIDVRDVALVWRDILRRPYITIGMAAFALMVPLAVTSSATMIARLGAARWRALHRLVYVITPLAAVHFVMVRKGWQIEPLAWLAAIVLLLALRLLPRRRRRLRPTS
ncbi:MAG TPA: protein-methionine-sulfoxide reductase heme-binding subunit MsrQ [Thermopetrobacter sp.]|nr:protein-methionine-sulfoxide reductase heme-binding subunit MsrQ [Thermopetrobacter sp.]